MEFISSVSSCSAKMAPIPESTFSVRSGKMPSIIRTTNGLPAYRAVFQNRASEKKIDARVTCVTNWSRGIGAMAAGFAHTPMLFDRWQIVCDDVVLDDDGSFTPHADE